MAKWLNKLTAKLQNWDWDLYHNGPRNKDTRPLRKSIRNEVKSDTKSEIEQATTDDRP